MVFLFGIYFNLFEVAFLKELRTLLILFLLFNFVVKLPLFGLHLWLPKAHTEAPSLGSIVLAGLLLKLGGFGVNMVLFSLTSFYSFVFFVFAFFGSLCRAFVSSLQRDRKVYVAFSSVTHINLTFFVLVMLLGLSKNISYIIIISHGVTASLIFWLIGLSYYASFSRSLYFNKGWCLRFLILILIIFFSNFRIPPMIVFFQEAIFVSVLYKLRFVVVFFLFFYIVFVIYYNIFLGVLFLIKNDLNVRFVSDSSFLFVFSVFMFNF
jgi:NADH-ubiquinone oxidoreductase chain 4